MDVGDRLADRYELLARIGHGGMGEVFRARDTALDREVALKVLPPHLSGDEASQRRFRREARAAAALVHPNVVSVHDVLVDGPQHALVMELVDGPSLADVLRAEGPLDVDRAVELARGIAAGLATAHERGLVHRDVKPSNVVLAPDGTPKITDFGIARMTDVTSTLTQQVAGSVPYLAPEQARGDEVDRRADLYALGCVLFEMLTGRPPFHAEQPIGVVYQQLHEEPPDPRDLRLDLPPALSGLVLWLLAKDPDARPASARDVIAQLDRGEDATAVLPHPGATTRVIPPATVPAGPPAATPPPDTEPAVAAARRPWPLALLLAAAAIAGAVATATLLDRDTTGAAPDEPRAEPPAGGTEAPGTEATDAGPAATETTTSTPPPSPEASPTLAPETFEDAVAGFRRTVVAHRQEGEISVTAVEELEKRLEDIVEKRDEQEDDDEPGEGNEQEVAKKIRELEKSLDELERDGQVTGSAPEALRAAIRDLDRLA